MPQKMIFTRSDNFDRKNQIVIFPVFFLIKINISEYSVTFSILKEKERNVSRLLLLNLHLLAQKVIHDDGSALLGWFFKAVT